MTTALVTHPDCLLHETRPGTEECVARLEVVQTALEGFDLARLEAPVAQDDSITTLHDPAYVARIRESVPTSGFVSLDPETDDETFLSPGSQPAIWRAVGGVQRAIDAVMTGQAQNAFAAIRPPGHRAEQALAMGFCVFGNVALGARYAMDHHGFNRVAIIDFDVHHGNGTQALLWDEPRALVITSQQTPLWPETGDPSERGAHDNIVNIPLAPGSDGADMRAAYNDIALPRLEAFRPELILISAGFDCHASDPLSDLLWVEEDYRWLTQKICELADKHCAGRVVSTLEGGYDLRALATSVATHVSVLMEYGA